MQAATVLSGDSTPQSAAGGTRSKFVQQRMCCNRRWHQPRTATIQRSRSQTARTHKRSRVRHADTSAELRTHCCLRHQRSPRRSSPGAGVNGELLDRQGYASIPMVRLCGGDAQTPGTSRWMLHEKHLLTRGRCTTACPSIGGPSSPLMSSWLRLVEPRSSATSHWKHYNSKRVCHCSDSLGRSGALRSQTVPARVQEGCEFLVAQGSDGRLNLDDVYVYDEETGIYARPDKVGDMPPGPRLFQQVHTSA